MLCCFALDPVRKACAHCAGNSSKSYFSLEREKRKEGSAEGGEATLRWNRSYYFIISFFLWETLRFHYSLFDIWVFSKLFSLAVFIAIFRSCLNIAVVWMSLSCLQCCSMSKGTCESAIQLSAVHNGTWNRKSLIVLYSACSAKDDYIYSLQPFTVSPGFNPVTPVLLSIQGYPIVYQLARPR